MAQALLLRFAGAALTIGSIALSAFINAKIPGQPLLHLAITGIAAVVAVAGISIYEDAAKRLESAEKPDSAPGGSGRLFAEQRTAQ